MKFQMHCKVCPRPVEGSKKVRKSKKAMMLRKQQHNVAEMNRRVYKHD